MTAIARITLLSLVLGLSACAVQPPSNEERLPPIPSSYPGSKPKPTTAPGKPVTPNKPGKPQPRTSASFAPPPGGNSHWDAKLGVYVLDDQTDTFYRQRTYYRWNNGWSRSVSPNGPWEEIDIHGVPPGLSKQYSQ